MTLPRRTVGAVLVALAAAVTQGAAQVPVPRSASFDVASLLDRDARVAFEPAAFGHLAINVVLARWDAGNLGLLSSPQEGIPVGRVTAATGREWMLDAGARFYPAALSSTNPRHRFAAYVGALVGLHRREGAPPWSGWSCDANGCAVPVNGGQRPAYGVAYGVEPTLEAGLRLLPIGPALLDLGVRSRLITFDDPAGNFLKGNVDTRLALNLGVAW